MLLERLPAFAISIQRRRIYWFYINVITAKSNIEKQIGFSHGNLYNLPLFSNSSPRKRGFPHETGFSLPHRSIPLCWSSSESKEPRFRLLEIEAHTSEILSELVFWRRQPRLVTYATEISLLRSLVASQQ